MDGVRIKPHSKNKILKLLVFGTIGLLFLGWLFNTPPGLLGKADAIGYAVCHRIDLRSFHLGDRTLPLCARCTGMHLGALLGLVYQSAISRRRAGIPPGRVLVVLVVLAGAFFLDGSNSFLSLIPGAPTLYNPQNWLRLFTGTSMGIVIAALLYPAFNQTTWRDWQPQPALSGIRQLAGLVLLAAILDLIVLTQNPLILYPLALLSAIAVLVELTLVYAMVSMMIFRSENAYTSLAKMMLPLTAGFGLGLAQIALLDVVRYLLTGTWDGFHLG